MKIKITLISLVLMGLGVKAQVIDDIGVISPQKQEDLKEEKKVRERKKDKSQSADYNDNTANLQIRHLKGMKSLNLQYGWAMYGNYVNIGYGHLLKDRLMFNVDLNYEYGKIGFSHYDYKNVKLGLMHTVYKIKNTVFMNVAYGGIAGVIQSKNEEIFQSEKKFNTGLYGGVNGEIYIVNKVSLLLMAEQQYNFMDKFGKWHFHLGGGLRFYIY